MSKGLTEFIDLILSASRDNYELETKVKEQRYIYAKYKRKIIKLKLMSIMTFPYGTFEVGYWTGETYEPRLTLKWSEHLTKWALTKEELENER